jgi:hypothetical protein
VQTIQLPASKETTLCISAFTEETLSALISSSNTVTNDLSNFNLDPDTSVVNNRGFTALDTLLNNHREESLLHLINKRDNEGWVIPYDLDLTKQLFTRDY